MSTGAVATTSSSFGFRNIIPRTRDERRSQCNKEMLEKQRLSNRRECFNEYQYMENPTATLENTPSYMSNEQRFVTDAAGEERARRDSEYARRQAMMDRKRRENEEKEKQRWDGMQKRQEEEQQRWDSVRGTNRTNQRSVAYDVLTLEVENTAQGQRLNEQMDAAKERARVRASNLYQQQHREGINPLTGERIDVSRVTRDLYK